MLFRFLFRNLKGLRLLVVVAIFVTLAQVGCDLLAALPLKFIPSKVSNFGNDPACGLTFLGVVDQNGDHSGLLTIFDTSKLDPSLQSVPPGGPDNPPPLAPCPASPGNANSLLHPVLTHHSVIGVIVFSVLMLLIFASLSALLVYLDLYLANLIAQSLSARLRKQLFEHLQRISLDWHGKQKKGDLVQRITGNIPDIEKLVTDGLVDLLGGVFLIIGVVVVMSTISVGYTLLSLAIVPALAVIVLFYTKNIKAAAKKQAKAAGQIAEVAAEDINALTVIKVFTREEREALRFGERVGQTQVAGLRAGRLQAQFTPIVTVVVALGTATVIGVGGYIAAGNPFDAGFFSIGANTIDVGTLLLFLIYLKLLYQPIRDLSKLASLSNAAGAGAERIQEVLDQAPEVIENTTTPYNGPQKLRGDISFEHVIFGYSPERPVLKGIDLHIPAGKKVALVGLSGGGKTTLVKLIPRFYEIQQGSVKVDGVDNRAYPLSVLRQNVSMVLQDSVLFEGSIRNNIEIGRPGASEADIIDAAKKAQMHETIMSLPDGYNTYVREQGKNFSGGQRQRLAIARAILRDAPILILDEPTAALDVEAEVEVMNAVDKLIVGRTVLLISHRLSTLGDVDEIIVLKDGHIVERGNYKQLKRQGGVFAKLVDEQNRHSAERAGEKSILRSAFAPLPQFDEERQPPSAHAAPQNWPAPAVPGPAAYQHQPTPPPLRPTPINNGPARGNADGSRQALQRARVLIEIDGKIVAERRLDQQVLTVGRLSNNDVQVPSQRVSRLHARIRWENGNWLIEDADSLNGLLVKGQRVERQHILANGDRIQVAPTAALRYESV